MTKQIHGHRVEATFRTKPMDFRNSNSSTKFAVNMKLVLQRLMIVVEWLQFNDDGLSRQNITSKVNFTCMLMSCREWVARLH